MIKHHGDITAAQVTCGRIANRVAELVEPPEYVSQTVLAASGGLTVNHLRGRRVARGLLQPHRPAPRGRQGRRRGRPGRRRQR